MIETWKFLAFTQDLVFSFSSRQCGTPQRSPRPPALVLEGFSSEERLEPGPGPLRCTSSSPPSRSQACPPLPCWAESSRWWWCPRPGPRPRAWWHRVLSFPHRAPPLHRVEAFLLYATREDILTTRWRKGEKLLPWWIGTISCEKTSEWRPVNWCFVKENLFYQISILPIFTLLFIIW